MNFSAPTASKKKKKTVVLPRSTVEYLKAWMMSPDHINHPYPTDKEKDKIMADTGIEMKQLTNWFVNNRKRFWKPRVEAHIQKQGKLSPPIPIQRIDDLLTEPKICPPSHFKLSMGRSSDHGIFKYSSSMPSQQEKFHLIAKNNSFEVPVLDYSQNVQSQIVSMGSACSFTSESDTHSITSDDHNFTQEESTLVVTDQRRRLVDGYDSNESIVSERGRSVVTPTSLTNKKRQREQGPTKISSQPSICRSRKDDVSKSSTIGSAAQLIQKRSFKDWQGACRYAPHGYDNTLPSLDEAATLFGFSAIKDF